MLRNRSLLILTSLLLFIITCSLLYNKNKTRSTDYISGKSEEIDMHAVDHYLIATNFALGNKFPVTGFLLDSNVYNIKKVPAEVGLCLDFLKKNGPVATFIRPPLYPLVVGCLFKLFGFKYHYVLYLNIFLAAFIVVALPLLGYGHWGRKGFASGLIAGAIFFQKVYSTMDLSSMVGTSAIELFSSFWVFSVFAVGILAEKKDKILNYLLWGGVIGLSFLSKPTLASLPIILVMYNAYRFRAEPFVLFCRKTIPVIAGILIAILPWTIYINHVRVTTQQERLLWCERAEKDMVRPEISDQDLTPCTKGDFDCDNMQDSALSAKVVKYMISYMWTYHSEAKSFIFITNVFGEPFLWGNNEYVVNNGQLHPECMFIKSSFYRSKCDPNLSPLLKIFSFYYHNPGYIFLIPTVRVIAFFKNYDCHRYYWLAVALWSICLIDLEIDRKGIKNPKVRMAWSIILLILVLCVYFFSLFFATYASILLFVPLSLVGIILYIKGNGYNKTSSIFPLIYISLLISVFFLMPNPEYFLGVVSISCLSIAYFTILLVIKFKQRLHIYSGKNGNE